MEPIIQLLKKHQLTMVYVDNFWITSIASPKIRVKNANLSAAVLQLVGELLQRL